MDIKIADAELEIMRILWREKRPLKVAEFKDELEQNKGWNKSTTHTLVARLRDKGLIEPTERYGVVHYNVRGKESPQRTTWRDYEKQEAYPLDGYCVGSIDFSYWRHGDCAWCGTGGHL